MEEKSPNHSVQRIVLPSGRKIDVVRFHDSPAGVQQELHVCPECRCEMVQPVTWTEASDEQWELLLQCPNCDWSTEGVFEQVAVEDLEERLDEGLADMLSDLQRLTQANMAEEIDRFLAALHADLILPEDF
ncbi:MAG TPA: hypothetical protein VGF70_11795 [Solirubrobacteraceae bacterium]|jgi:hypothetical protein